MDDPLAPAPRSSAHIAEQRLCSRIPTAHRTSPNISSRSANYTPDLARKVDFFRILLEAAGVPCGPVYNYRQMFADPQVRHRGLIQYATDAELGEVPHIRTPIKIGEGVRVRTVAPKLGQHNAEIFGRLGVSEAEIRDLQAKGVL
jgi:crotonobetainyl-CoA:carnitine CoA-transferase CaiB-like acyl-CoA transferase